MRTVSRMATTFLCAAAFAAVSIPLGGSAVLAVGPPDPGLGLSEAAPMYRGLAPSQRCGSGLRLKETRQCTTGPEGEEMTSVAGVASGSVSGADPHFVRCYGDGLSGSRLQAIYAVASDQVNRSELVLPLVRQAAGFADEVFRASAEAANGTRHLRWVTTGDCQLDVQVVVIDPAADDSFTATREALRLQGFDKPDRKYVVWVDANLYCGIATMPNDDRDAVDNAANTETHYARIDTPCWNYTNSIEAHEIAHMLGAVQLSAPHSNGSGHCTDDADLLCYADASGVPTTSVCDAVFEPLLDCNHDDYFNPAPEPGSYLDTHWNVADSAFLTDEEGIVVTMPETAVWSWSGALSRKVPSVEHRQSVASGGIEVELSFTKTKSMRVSIVDPLGRVLGIAEGRSPLHLSAPVTAGVVTLRVDGATSGSYTLRMLGWKPISQL